MANKKKIEKAIESLEKQKALHIKKIKEHDKEKEYLTEYWEKQIKAFEKEIERRKKKIR